MTAVRRFVLAMVCAGLMAPWLGASQAHRRSPDPALGASVVQIVSTFYAARDSRPVWLQGAAREVAMTLLEHAAAGEHGLCPVWTNPEVLRAQLQSYTAEGPTDAGPIAAPELDMRITESLAEFLAQMGRGRHTVVTGESLSVRALGIVSLLEQAAIGRPASDILDVAAPRHLEYDRLQRAFQHYRGLAARGGWPSLPDDLYLAVEQQAPRVVIESLRERLRISGDLSATPTVSSPLGGPPPAHLATLTYDDTLAEAVRRFQARHGLAIDGIVGPHTVRTLNVSVAHRLRQIAINMDRWRRLPDLLGQQHVRVNIPAFTLAYVENGQPLLEMRTVVGEPENQTPSFSDRIRYLEFNPYWNVPRSITVNELAPQAAEDPAYLEERGFEVLDGWQADAETIDPQAVDWEAERFSYRLRQQPGPDNALGLVKFMFPNRYSVYLHDTPARHWFARPDRARSHGCVRVERPAELANQLLQDNGGWTLDRVQRTMAAEQRLVVPLDRPVPVHLLYFTAWADTEGVVHFRDDIYDRDARNAEWFFCNSSSGVSVTTR